MAIVDVLMPKMGESVMEGQVLAWLKQVGDSIEEEESLLEIATDKVDTEIPSPISGKVVELLANVGDTVQIDSVIARIEVEGANESTSKEPVPSAKQEEVPVSADPVLADNTALITPVAPQPGRFYSPLVLNIARTEGISMSELETVPGNGKDGRVTKKDILSYVKSRGTTPIQTPVEVAPIVDTKKETTKPTDSPAPAKETEPEEIKVAFGGSYEIQEMSRMRKIIADRMIDSRKTSAHVTSFVEADVTEIVYWRNRWKKHFKEKEDTALTFTPIFIEAVAKAIKDYPGINSSVQGDKIILKKDINIGMAVALPNGDLIVPVIKNADQLNIVGLNFTWAMLGR